MKFSIILPTYNRAGTYLKGAIDSIVSQSYDNWELLIIDNHSQDFTDELIDSYKDHRIKTYKIHNIVNIAKSRNLGIKNSSGDYISLIDIEFKLQGINFLGTQEAAPCYWMNGAIAEGAEEAMKGRGGLRAKILTDGRLKKSPEG